MLPHAHTNGGCDGFEPTPTNCASCLSWFHHDLFYHSLPLNRSQLDGLVITSEAATTQMQDQMATLRATSSTQLKPRKAASKGPPPSSKGNGFGPSAPLPASSVTPQATAATKSAPQGARQSTESVLQMLEASNASRQARLARSSASEEDGAAAAAAATELTAAAAAAAAAALPDVREKVSAQSKGL